VVWLSQPVEMQSPGGVAARDQAPSSIVRAVSGNTHESAPSGSSPTLEESYRARYHRSSRSPLHRDSAEWKPPERYPFRRPRGPSSWPLRPPLGGNPRFSGLGARAAVSGGAWSCPGPPSRRSAHRALRIGVASILSAAVADRAPMPLMLLGRQSGRLMTRCELRAALSPSISVVECTRRLWPGRGGSPGSVRGQRCCSGV
jgi:hypothetical protein